MPLLLVLLPVEEILFLLVFSFSSVSAVASTEAVSFGEGEDDVVIDACDLSGDDKLIPIENMFFYKSVNIYSSDMFLVMYNILG